MKRIILFTVLLILLSSLATAVCTVTFDKDDYFPLSTVTATLSCSEQTEKNTDYILLWYVNGTNVENDTGTTPAVASTSFFQTYILPDTTGNVSANLTGVDLEGYDIANISGVSQNSLIITHTDFTPTAFIGELFSVDFTVTDENGKLVNNADCYTFGASEDNAPLQVCGGGHTRNGRSTCSGILQNIFSEGSSYIVRTRCNCGIGDNACFDEDGNQVNSSTGSTTTPFTTNTWLSVNTVTDKTNYNMKDEIFICANVTNVEYTSRIPLHIYHQLRCSSGNDENYDLDRILLISDDDSPDERGISTNTTQMQCKRFIFPEAKYLQGKSSECYASTSTYVLDYTKNEIIGYYTTSQVFNITSGELNLLPDWQRTSDYTFNSVINLSEDSYSGFNGTGMGQIDLKINSNPISIRSYEQDNYNPISLSNMFLMNQISNISVYNLTGSQLDYNLEFLDDGSIEIEIQNADMSQSGWYNVTLEFESFNQRNTESFENQTVLLSYLQWLTGANNSLAGMDLDSDYFSNLTYLQQLDYLNNLVGMNGSLDNLTYSNDRQASALEEIANKTGTFAFSITYLDPFGIPGSDINVTISAQVEEPDVPFVEGHFICYVEGYQSETEVRWANAVNSTSPYIVSKLVTLPNNLTGTNSIVCKVGESAIGNPYTTASETFKIKTSSGGAAVVEKVKETIDKITEEFQKLDPKKKVLVVICLIILCLCIFGRRRKEKEE